MFTAIYSLMGGHVSKDGLRGGAKRQREVERAEATRVFRETGIVPAGWLEYDGILVKADEEEDDDDDDEVKIARKDPDASIEGLLGELRLSENSVGRGPLAFLSEAERGNFALASKDFREFKREFRPLLPESEMMRMPGFYDDERYRARLSAYKSPLRIVLPRYATLADIELLRDRFIPIVDLNWNKEITDAQMTALKGVRELNLSHTNITDAGLARVADRLEVLIMNDTAITGAVFPLLRRLRFLSYYRQERPPITFEALPVTLEDLEINVYDEDGRVKVLFDADLMRLTKLRRLALYYIDSATTFPASVEELILQDCRNINMDTFKGRTMKLIDIETPTGTSIPQPLFVEHLIVRANYDNEDPRVPLRRGLKWQFPDCEQLQIVAVAGIRLEWFVLCKSLRSLTIEFSEIVGYDPSFWENLRQVCPRLVYVSFSEVDLWDVDGVPTEVSRTDYEAFGFDYRLR